LLALDINSVEARISQDVSVVYIPDLNRRPMQCALINPLSWMRRYPHAGEFRCVWMRDSHCAVGDPMLTGQVGQLLDVGKYEGTKSESRRRQFRIGA
jgi:hypothetical protein